MYSVISCPSEDMEHIINPFGQNICIFQCAKSVGMRTVFRQNYVFEGADFLGHALYQQSNLVYTSVGVGMEIQLAVLPICAISGQ